MIDVVILATIVIAFTVLALFVSFCDHVVVSGGDADQGDAPVAARSAARHVDDTVVV